MAVTRRTLLGLGAASALAGLIGSTACGRAAPAAAAPGSASRFPVHHSEAEWRQRLTPAQFAVLRQHATERAGSSPLDREHRTGTFHCAGCRQALFASSTKFNSRTGWPSFWAPLDGAVGETRDNAFGMARVEVHCSRCGGHLGHVFSDGPRPTGLRYCMNGAALLFEPAASEGSAWRVRT